MKKRHLFMSLLAALAFASCSSDNEFDSEKGPNSGNGEDSYIAVNIVTPRNFGTRGSDGGFDVGSDMENKAETGMFLFYDAAGNPTQTPQTSALTWKTSSSTTSSPMVEKISEAVVVIAGNTQPTQVLVVLNAPTTLDLTNKSLSEARGLIANYSASTEGNFIMTNSVYLDDNDKEICATDIDRKTYKTAEEAKNHATDIYVERVVAKITTSAIGDNFAQGEKIEIDGKEYTLKQEINGIEIANVAQTSHLFKNITGYANWGTDFASWNDATNKRCYWATSPADLEYGNKKWNAIENDPKEAQTYYVQENTTAQRTSVLVTATLKDDNNQPISFVKWAGNYYLKDTFLKQYAEIVKNAGYRLKTTEGNETAYSTIDYSDEDGNVNFAWLTADEHEKALANNELEQYEMTAKVVEPEGANWTVVKINGTNEDGSIKYEDSSVEDINKTLKGKTNRVWLWEKGKCYYFKEIEHLNNDKDNTTKVIGEYGVVRNHVYKLTLNSLKGVGVPVYNPDEVIIPEKPSDDLFYFAAQINILQWKIVEQTVDFE